MNTVINNDAANRLHEISVELAKPISADTESIRRLRDISKELASIASSIEQNINLESEDETAYRRALEVIHVTKRASIPHFQRKMEIGFNRASRIIKMLEERGVVGTGTLTGRREIKIDLEDLK